MTQTWRCKNGHEKEVEKPGASEGSRGFIRCRECGEKVLARCVDEVEDEGVPWNT